MIFFPQPIQIEGVDFNAFVFYLYFLLLFFFAAKFVDSKLRAGNKVEDKSIIRFKVLATAYFIALISFSMNFSMPL